MARHWKIAVALLALLAVIGLASLPTLLRSVMRLRHASVSEEEARRELIQPSIVTPTDSPKKAKLFWAGVNTPATLEPTEIQLPLSADAVQRAKQLIVALITRVPSAAQRTLPADTELLQFYLLPDGTAIADFSEALTMETPSGILSEQMAVDSLVRTLAENGSSARQLKILIRGQEASTLAGHLDLTGFFAVEAAPPAAAPTSENLTPASPPAAGASPSAALPGTAPVASAPAAVVSPARTPLAPLPAAAPKSP